MRTNRLIGLAGVLAVQLVLVSVSCAKAQSVEDLRQLSIDQLSDIDVSSVTKSTESLRNAPAAIYVITHDDILRSGAASLPDILRLAPNLFVAQTSASTFVVTARGFSGSAAAQNFSNKLLVLIDGRSVYTPLYSGVYWDVQDVLPEDIERIEVISGPGATLWGANAVNGVINIITRKSSQTQGGFVDVGAGNLGRMAAVQYGGRLNDTMTYRVYAKTFQDDDTVTATGAKLRDNWSKPQGGFRFDWAATPADDLTLQGDVYRGDVADSGPSTDTVGGGNLLGRWNHSWQDGSSLQVQAYFDRVAQSTSNNGGSFWVDTYDFDLQHSFDAGNRNQVVWGGGVRSAQYGITGAANLFFVPPGRTLLLADLFAQDSLTITDNIKLIAGLKLEDDPYSGIEPLPSVRLSWKMNDDTLLWAAVSRAIRSPTPFDRDVVENIVNLVRLTGNPDFETEKLTAYEIGARLQPTSRLSFSVSLYNNAYDDLRSIEVIPDPHILRLEWGNGMRGETYGVEAWGDYRLTRWWRLTAGYAAEHEHLTFKPGDPGVLGAAEAGDDPPQQGFLRSSMNLGSRMTFDADLRYVAALPNPMVPAYTELNCRIGWNVTDRVQLSVSGFNLVHPYHLEFPSSEGGAVPRSVFAEVRWRL
jgi:iron complex outermembrane receptor protein